MLRTVTAFAENIARTTLFRASHARPLFPLYHVTPFCNLGCEYCEGFPEVGLPGAESRRVAGRDRALHELDTRGVTKLLGILRRRFACLFLTGGEPLIRDDIVDIVTTARNLGFRQISINTNGVLLREREESLRSITHLIVSLDTLDADAYARTIGASRRTAEKIIDNVDRCAGLQERFGFRLVVHAVICPDDPAPARALLEFCVARGIWVCLSPRHTSYHVDRSTDRWGEYESLIEHVMDLKRAGRRISGSLAFYENVRKMEPYVCLPFLIPRILPTGDLLYPCRPRGRVACNILDSGSWSVAEREAVRRFGPVRRCEESCRIRCYIEPSILMRKPLELLKELI